MAERKCLRCGGVLTPSADEVCVPCLLRQGAAYQKTGDVRAFTRAAPHVHKNGETVVRCIVCGELLSVSSFDPCEGYYLWCKSCDCGPYGPYTSIPPEVRK